MKSFPFDSHVSYDKDGMPIFDRAIDSTVYRGLLGKLFTTGVSAEESTNLQVVANGSMAVNILAGFAVVDGAMTLNEDETSLTIEAADRMYDRIDTVVIRLDNNDDVRNCELHVIKGTPSANPQRPALTREASIYEIGLADVYVRVGATSINSSDITDTRYEAKRCGIVTAAGDVGDFIRALSERVRELEAGATAEDGERFQFAYDEQSDKYGYKVKNEILPFGGTKIIIDGKEVTSSISIILAYIWGNAFVSKDIYSEVMFSAVDGSNNIHFMGEISGTSGNTDYYKQHFKYGSGVFSSLTQLPVMFVGGCALTDADGNVTVFIPYRTQSDRYEIRQYKYIDNAWVSKASVSVSGYDYVQYSKSVVYAALAPDGNIHVIFHNVSLGTIQYPERNSHFVCNTDGAWSEIGTTPDVGPIVVDKNGNIHMFVYTSSISVVTHYVYKDGSWSSVDTFSGSAVSFTFLDANGDINIFREKNQYKYVSGQWKLVGQMAEVVPSNAFVVDDTLTAFGIISSSLPYELKLYKASSSLMLA